MNIEHLFSWSKLLEETSQGYVRLRRHPDDNDLMLANYTEKAQYEKRWNGVTLNCRGLIFRGSTGEIVARPFPKFFNYGEHEAGSLSLDTPATVVDKLDGSLGILYPTPQGGWALATRGSFESDQAMIGTRILRDQYLPYWTPTPGVTYLFEILYPENRIVLDYGPLQDIVFLGGVVNATGRVVGPSFQPLEYTDIRSLGGVARTVRLGWPGPRASVFEATSLREALAMPPRDNAEGVVVRLATGTMVKLKQEDYVLLHKLVTGLNERVVWEHLAENISIEGLLKRVPDEFHGWVNGVTDELHERFERIQSVAHAAFHAILGELDVEAEGSDGWGRKDFAFKARAYTQYAPLLFNLLDSKDIAPAIWKAIRPVGERPFRRVEEEAAV